MIGNYLTIYRTNWYIILVFILISINANAQDSTYTKKESIAVIAKPSSDSIILRWAPVNAKVWNIANRYGYSIERFTLVRNGQVVKPVEHTQINSEALKPIPEDAWERFIQTGEHKYALIAAQALYGESFNLDIQHSSIMQVVNKAKENDQRYSIAMFCADMSPEVAKAQGLYFTDRNIEKNVKYLYRVRIYTAADTISGSVFIDSSESFKLSSVDDLSAEVTGKIVTLRWNQLDFANMYTAYVVERSENQQDFTEISDIPGVVIDNQGADAKYQYIIDSIVSPDLEYSYRIRGITPFGEKGPASNVVKVKENKIVTSIVSIKTGYSTDNKNVTLEWEFPGEDNSALQGFEITRSSSPSGKYTSISKNYIPSSLRTFKDTSALQSNYYVIKAKTLDGSEILSLPYLVMLIDSIPPAAPIGLKGTVSENGNVSLSWNRNSDPDLFGYRIYRSYYQSNEFAQVTSDPISDTVFTDKVNLGTLNKTIHYQLMAIDRNQNQSNLSQTLSLTLPDKVPPVPPTWLPVESTSKGVVLRWLSSPSQDVVRYDVYRKEDKRQWIRLASVPAKKDTAFTYVDSHLKNSDVQQYVVIAVDDSSLESARSPVVAGFKLSQSKPPVEMNAPFLDTENKRITISWLYTEELVDSFRIYRKLNDQAFLLYRTVKEQQFNDEFVVPGNEYTYFIIAVYSNGSLSGMGKTVKIKF